MRTEEPEHHGRILILSREQTHGTLSTSDCLLKLRERYGHHLYSDNIGPRAPAAFHKKLGSLRDEGLEPWAVALDIVESPPQS